MNTEARVLAMLNKVKEVQSKRKDFGAIEDAINDSKNQMEIVAEKLNSITNDLSQEIDDVVGQIESLKEGLSSAINANTQEWNSTKEELNNIQKDFDKLGLNYDNPFEMSEQYWEDVIYYGNIVVKSQIQ